MTADLVRGQNHPLPGARLEIRLSAGHPVVVCVTLTDERGTVHEDRVAHPGAPALPGVEVFASAADTARCAVDLSAVPPGVHRVNVLLALPEGAGGPVSFGATTTPFVAVLGQDGSEVAGFAVTGLDTETALVAVELYRRQDAWKVRAVGQGYAGGLAQLLRDQGLPAAHETAALIQRDAAARGPRAESAPLRTPSAAEDGYAAPGPVTPASPVTPAAATGPDPARPADRHRPATPGGSAGAVGGPISYAHPRRGSVPPPPATPADPPPAATSATPAAPAVPDAEPGRPAPPVAGDATGWSMEERLHHQIWGMFEDLARAVAAYRSAVEFAESRLDRELDQALADPRGRVGGTADDARRAARAKCEELTALARRALDRDLDRLQAESEVVEPALAPAFARWDNPAWHAYRVPMERPMALRLGDLQLPEARELRIPLLVRLPLERGLWVDSGRGPEAATALDGDRLRRSAMECAVAHAARLIAVHPPGDFSVHVIDPAGTGAGPLAPLIRSGVLAAPPAAGARGVSETLTAFTRRVDLVSMAVRGGAADSLPPELDTAEQLLIVHDFPHGFDDRAVTQLRYLADEGPAVGVHLMMVADREDASAYGPVLDPLWRSLLRLTPVPDDHLADPWVRHAWTYHPPAVPPGSAVLEQVLGQVGAARRSWGL
ncbi:TerD family protein [Streptomyces sp. NPDC014894]|uniref:TerD family protein n=1 Tax=Streptomyces sp. NPDC014894 TaxID=3364931 RepID=UPI0037024DE9